MSEDFVERLEFYKGSVVVQYSHKHHSYYRESPEGLILIPGSTTVLGMKDKSGPLTQWAANSTVLYTIQNLNLGNIDPQMALEYFEHLRNKAPWEDPDDRFANAEFTAKVKDLIDLLNVARFNYRKIKEDAADVGRQAHNWLEGLINAMIESESTPDTNIDYMAKQPDDERARASIKSAIEWMNKHNFKPIHAEKKIYSLRYDYCGTYDIKALIDSCGNPKCCPFSGRWRAICDFKTSKSLYDDYRLQVASYKEAEMEEYPDEVIDGCVLIHIPKDGGELQTIAVPHEEHEKDFEAFLGLLAIFNWQKQIDVDAKMKKENDKAAKKASAPPKVRKVKVKTQEVDDIPVAPAA